MNKNRQPSSKDVIKHSGAIHMSGRVSLLERKTWNVLLSNAFNNLEKKETYEISLRDLAQLLRYNSNDQESLKNSLRTLNHTQVEWNMLEKDKGVWEATTLLAGVKIINGVCQYEYSFVLREKLSDPAMYARLNLFQQSLFKKKHAHILWELFKDYFDEKKAYGETPWITIERLRKLLGLKDEYSQFYDLNKWVIKRAIKEINEVSDLFVNLKNGIKKRREGRKIGAIKFIIRRNLKNRPSVKMLEELTEKGQTVLPVPEFEIENHQLLDALISEFGISKNKAVKILKTKDEFYIKENLEVIRKQIKADKVKDIPAYTVKAIEDDYRRKKPKAEIEKEKRKEKKMRMAQLKKMIEIIELKVTERRRDDLEAKKEKLSEAELDALRKEFGTLISTGEQGEFMQAQFLSKGWKMAGIKTHFSFFLESKLLLPKVEYIKSISTEKGVDYFSIKEELESIKEK